MHRRAGARRARRRRARLELRRRALLRRHDGDRVAVDPDDRVATLRSSLRVRKVRAGAAGVGERCPPRGLRGDELLLEELRIERRDDLVLRHAIAHLHADRGELASCRDASSIVSGGEEHSRVACRKRWRGDRRRRRGPSSSPRAPPSDWPSGRAQSADPDRIAPHTGAAAHNSRFVFWRKLDDPPLPWRF